MKAWRLMSSTLAIAFILSFTKFENVGANTGDEKTKAQVFTQRSQLPESFLHHIDWLNELTERRRVNTFFLNEQSVFFGVQKGYVNVGKGNLTFIRRDLVIVGRIPIVLARVYDSSQTSPSDFSPGWRLTLTETITALKNGDIVYTDDSLSETRFVRQGAGYAATPTQPSDIRSVEQVKNGYLVTYRNGWTKRLDKLGKAYRLARVTDNNGNALDLNYDAKHRLTRVNGQNGRSVTIARNELGQITRIFDEGDRSVRFGYNQHNQLAFVTDLGGHEWEYQYAANGKLKKVVDPLGREAATFAYHKDGKVMRSNIRGEKYTYVYSGEKTELRDNRGSATQFRQNKDGITVSIANAEGVASAIALDSRCRVERLDHNGRLHGQFSYDEEGNPINLIRYDEFERKAWSYRFNWQNRLVEIQGDDGDRAVLDYDERGNLLRRRENGETVSFSYGANGDRLTESRQGVETRYQYNPDGQITRIAREDNTVVLRYTATGRLARIQFPDGMTHRYQYNDLGFRTATERGDGSFTAYVYDAAGNLIGIGGRLTSRRSYQRDFNLDGANQLISITHQSQADTVIRYDATGNPKVIDTGDGVIRYGYDKANRLVSIEEPNATPMIYHYQDSESDIRIQMDGRTCRCATGNARQSQSFDDLASLFYSRGLGQGLLPIEFARELGVLNLASSWGLTLPTDPLSELSRRTQINAIGQGSNKGREAFDRPSNILFLPPEFASANCDTAICFLPHSVSINTSVNSPVTVGDTVNFYGSLGDNASGMSHQCPLGYDWYVNGVFQPGFSSSSFSHEFGAAGAYEIKYLVECDTCDSPTRQAVEIWVAEAAIECPSPAPTEATGVAMVRLTPNLAAPTNGSCGGFKVEEPLKSPELEWKCDDQNARWTIVVTEAIVEFRFRNSPLTNPLTMSKINSETDCATLTAYDQQLALMETIYDCPGVNWDIPHALVWAHENVHKGIRKETADASLATFKATVGAFTVPFSQASTPDQATAHLDAAALQAALVNYFNNSQHPGDEHEDFDTRFFEAHKNAVAPFRQAIADRRAALGCN